MPFNSPLTMAYSADGTPRPTFSHEEYTALLAEGWLEEKPAPVVEPSPELIAEVPAEPVKRGPGRPRKVQEA